MKKALFLLLLLTLSIQSRSINRFDAQLGFGYIDHLFVGVGYKFTDNSRLSANCGSNFFIRLNNFSTYYLQYDYLIKKWPDHPYSMKIGIKAAYSTYSDTYYRWKLASLAPLIDFSYTISPPLIISFMVGYNYSKTLSVERIKIGEIGWYKEHLPDFKISFVYALF